MIELRISHVFVGMIILLMIPLAVHGQTASGGWGVKEGSYVPAGGQAAMESEQEVTTLRNEIISTTRELYQEDFDRIRDELISLRDSFGSLQTRIDQVSTDVTQMKTDLDGMKREVYEIKHPPEVESPSFIESFSVPFLVLLAVNFILILLLVFDLAILRKTRKHAKKAAKADLPPHVEQIRTYLAHHMQEGAQFETLRRHLKHVGWQDQDIMQAYQTLQ